MTLPSVLVVPGAWHKPDHFRLLVDELSGIDVHTVTLTSSGDDPAALRDMHADADVIARAAAAIEGPVVVVAHSYGGVPTTQAFRQAGNVARIIYVAAFQLLAGESLVSARRRVVDAMVEAPPAKGDRRPRRGRLADDRLLQRRRGRDRQVCGRPTRIPVLRVDDSATDRDGLANDPEHLRDLRSRQRDSRRG